MKFEIYKDRADEWRWTLKAANGKRIANGGEGYHNYGDLLDIIKTFVQTMQTMDFALVNLETDELLTFQNESDEA